MKAPIDNTQELKDFVETHNLSNEHSIIHFNALVSISTATNKISNQQIEIRITFDGYNNYGTVSFVNDNLEPSLYPTVFQAQWQDIEHTDKDHLLITGNHTMNSEIGKYSVKITPIGIIS